MTIFIQVSTYFRSCKSLPVSEYTFLIYDLAEIDIPEDLHDFCYVNTHCHDEFKRAIKGKVEL